MSRAKITQQQAIFYQLYEKRAVDPEQYTPIWQLIGEVFIKEMQQWAFVSYEVSARMSELYKQNPQWFERKIVEGKTGAKYYAYRIALAVRSDYIKDDELKEFWLRIKSLSANRA